MKDKATQISRQQDIGQRPCRIRVGLTLNTKPKSARRTGTEWIGYLCGFAEP